MNKSLFSFLGCLAQLFIVIALVGAKLWYVEVKYPLPGTVAPPGSPWPMPQMLGPSSSDLLYLKKSLFKIESNMLVYCDLVHENIRFYTNILFPPRIYSEEPLDGISDDYLFRTLKIEIENNGACPGYPHSKMNEYYNLTIERSTGTIKAPTVWGALRGLETFSQLTFFNDNNQLALNDSTFISDFPRFEYRGLLLDTSRHFIPVPTLRKQIDAMAYNKFNVFHWHIVDDQSFPMESKAYPNLTINGRYSPAHVYTRKDIETIIEHARLRGIRVLPEFDTPGHVDSFGKTFPQFITVCWNDGKPYQAIYSVQGEAEILNPTLEELYPVLENVLEDYKSIFPDEYIHLGMDEVYYACWKSNPNISEWMAMMNFTEYNQLEAYYSSRMLNIAKKLEKKAIVWQDVFDNGVKLDMSTVVQIWKDTATLPHHGPWSDYLNNITQAGYQVILSSPWYINFVSYGFQEWFKWYEIEPMRNFTGTEEQKKLFIGGETALWTEYVDGTNIESRLWPRASVIAERLWSDASVNNSEDAKFRLDEHRCRMLRRGIPATPVLNGYCGDYEYGMKNSVVFEKVFNYDWPIMKEKVTTFFNAQPEGFKRFQQNN